MSRVRAPSPAPPFPGSNGAGIERADHDLDSGGRLRDREPGVLLILLVIAAPKYSRPLLAEPLFEPTAVVAISLGLAVYGWMLRIFFASPDRDAPHWRYRTPPN